MGTTSLYYTSTASTLQLLAMKCTLMFAVSTAALFALGAARPSLLAAQEYAAPLLQQQNFLLRAQKEPQSAEDNSLELIAILDQQTEQTLRAAQGALEQAAPLSQQQTFLLRAQQEAQSAEDNSIELIAALPQPTEQTLRAAQGALEQAAPLSPQQTFLLRAQLQQDDKSAESIENSSPIPPIQLRLRDLQGLNSLTLRKNIEEKDPALAKEKEKIAIGLQAESLEEED